jgi:hypothetical protein
MNWIGDVGVRPEMTRVGAAAPSGVIARAARVTGIVYLGAFVNVEARLESGESVVAQIAPDAQPFVLGDAVQVWWSASDELRFPE